MSLTTRQLEALDTGSNLVVTAGAGSGKTKVLVERYLSILREEPDTMPSNIIALTFTEKASLEMKERIRKEVRILSDEEGGRWDDILDDLEGADISTIHSFCTSIIRSEPLSLGFDPDIVVLSENETSLMIKELMTDIFIRQSPASEPLRRLMVDHGHHNVAKMIKGLLTDRSRLPFDIGTDELSKASLRFHLRTSHELLERALADLDDLKVHLGELSGLEFPDNSADSGVRVMMGIGEVLRLASEDPTDDMELMSAISRSRDHLLNKNGGERSSSRLGNNRTWGLDHKLLKDCMAFLYSFAHTYKDILVFVEKEGLMDRARDRIGDLLAVVSHINGTYNRKKREMNGMDFDDQISMAMTLLENDTNGILGRMRKRYHHLLIDEFQDTDPRQWRLAELIWNNGRSSILFIVGDPKQSIYGFRSADVRLFLKASASLAVHDQGNVVVLDRNFRSSSEVMEFVNTIFPKIMGRDENDWSVPFDPLEPHRSKGGSVNVVGIIGRKGSEAREGRMAAELIKRAMRGWEVQDEDGPRRPMRFSDIAILLPTRKGFERYEEALRQFTIPYQVYKGKGFFARQEIADVLDLLEHMCDPNNDIALASVLKGPFFSLSDEELISISIQGSRSLIDRLSSHDDLSWIAGLLSELRDISRTETPGIALEIMFERTHIHATAGGRRHYRNLDKLLDWVSSPGTGETIWDVRNSLKRMIEEPPKEGESPITTDEDAVTVLTVHAAKGLEWPMVMVLGLQHVGKGDQGSSYQIDPDDGISIKVLDTTTGDHVPTPAMKLSKERSDQKETEERKRLFYVACTRARDHLVLSGELPVDRNGQEQRPGGMMGLLKDGIDLTIEDLEDRSKRVGDVDVRLFAVRPDGDVEEEGEEEEEEIEHVIVKTEIPSTCGEIFSKPWGFLNPTSEEVLSMLGKESKDDLMEYRREFNIEGPAPDEIGNMVHRVLEGIPLMRVIRESGYPEAMEMIRKMVEDIRTREKVEGEPFREIEVVAEVTIDGNKVLLKGRADLVLLDGEGNLTIVDYKTGKKQKEHTSQLRAYELLFQSLSGGDIRSMVISPDWQ